MIGRSKEEQELNDLLVKTLVTKEVLEPMAKIGWGHGNPPAPDYTTTPAGNGQPAPTEGAPGQQAQQQTGVTGGPPAVVKSGDAPASPTADTLDVNSLVALYESLRDPATGLIANKYKTVPEAIKGGVHLTRMAHSALRERDEAKQKLAEITSGSTLAPRAPTATPSPTPAQPNPAVVDAKAKLDKVLSDIDENGGVLSGELGRQFSEASAAFAEAAATAKVQEVRQAEEAEKARWSAVDEYMRDKYPASLRFSEEIALHLESDPLTARAVRALISTNDLQGATEMAWLSFEKVHGEQVATQTQTAAQVKEDELAAREQVRKEQLAVARKDAGIVTGSAGGAGGHENNGPRFGSREEIEAAANAMRREGMAPGSPAAMAWRKMVIGPSLPQSIFGPQ